METKQDSKHWLQTLPGLVTAIAGLLGAITALVVAIAGLTKSTETAEVKKQENVPIVKTVVDECLSPFVWRLAVSSDHVCVTEDSRRKVEAENARAAERRHPSGGAYGADTCLSGYVWREAFTGDTVCVLPDRRVEVKEENTLAYQRLKR